MSASMLDFKMPETDYYRRRSDRFGIPDSRPHRSPEIFWPRKRTLADKIKFCYVRLVLSTPFLKHELRTKLHSLGVECLEEGAANEAYGIIEECSMLVRLLAKVEEVLAVEESTPPSGK